MVLRILQFLVGFVLLAGGGYVAWLNRDLATAMFPPNPNQPLWLLVGPLAAASLGLVLALGALASRKKQRLEKQRQAEARRQAIRAADDLYARRASAVADRDWRDGPLPPEPKPEPGIAPDPTPSSRTPPSWSAEAEVAPEPAAEPEVVAPSPRLSFNIPPPEPRPVFTAPPPEPEPEPEPAFAAPEPAFGIPPVEARPVFTAPEPEPAISQLEPEPVAAAPEPEPAPERVPEHEPVVAASPPPELVAQPAPTPAPQEPVSAAPPAQPTPAAPPAFKPVASSERLSSLPEGLSGFPAAATLGPLPRATDPPARPLPAHSHLGFAVVPKSRKADANGVHAPGHVAGDALARIRAALADSRLDDADHLIAEERTRLKNAGDSEALALAELAAVAGDHAAAAGRIGGAKWLWRLSLRRFADIDAISSPEARAVSERLRLADQ